MFHQNLFSMEINQVFETAAENALSRFKTPVITSEILFIRSSIFLYRRNSYHVPYVLP